MNCERCGGLLFPEEDELGWIHKCGNCGRRYPVKTRVQKADELVRSIDAERLRPAPLSAEEMVEHAQKVIGTIISDDNVKPIRKEKKVPTCTRSGCTLPRCAESVHCEKHWQSRKKSNANQRLKARTERYEGARTQSETDALIAPLLKRIEHYKGKIAAIEEIITRLRGL